MCPDLGDLAEDHRVDGAVGTHVLVQHADPQRASPAADHAQEIRIRVRVSRQQETTRAGSVEEIAAAQSRSDDHSGALGEVHSFGI